MEGSTLAPILFALGPIVFVGLSCAVFLLISRVSGWRRLADRFSARGPALGTCYKRQTGKVGPVSYKGCLNISLAPEGLFLSVMWPFGLGHRPLFLPWNVIRDVHTRRTLWIERVKFEVGAPDSVTVQLPKKIWDAHPRFFENGQAAEPPIVETRQLAREGQGRPRPPAH